MLQDKNKYEIRWFEKNYHSEDRRVDHGSSVSYSEMDCYDQMLRGSRFQTLDPAVLFALLCAEPDTHDKISRRFKNNCVEEPKDHLFRPLMRCIKMDPDAYEWLQGILGGEGNIIDEYRVADKRITHSCNPPQVHHIDLQFLANIIRYRVLIPFLCSINAPINYEEHYRGFKPYINRMANGYNREEDSEWARFFTYIEQMLANAYMNVGPGQRCLRVLVQLPYDSFYDLLTIIRDGNFPLIDRVIQVERVQTISEMLDNLLNDATKLGKEMSKSTIGMDGAPEKEYIYKEFNDIWNKVKDLVDNHDLGRRNKM